MRDTRVTDATRASTGPRTPSPRPPYGPGGPRAASSAGGRPHLSQSQVRPAVGVDYARQGRLRPPRPMARPAHPTRTKGRRVRPRRRHLAGLGLVAVAAGVCGALLVQVNGTGGALAADLLRAVIGPAATARVEVAYLGLSDTLRYAGYHLGAQRVRAPWTVPATVAALSPRPASTPPVDALPALGPARVTTVITTVAPPAAPTSRLRAAPPVGVAGRTRVTRLRDGRGRTRATAMPRRRVVVGARRQDVAPAPRARRLLPMRLPPLSPLVTPALPGEGLWTTAGLPGPGSGARPPVAKAFIRPDAARPYALVTLLQVDLRVARLHVVAGTAQPGGPRGLAGPGVIPSVDWQGDRLLAAFNGGFKYADGAYGLMSGGTVYVPPVWGAATVALTSAGHVIMGAWGLDRRLTGANGGLTAWRQNGPLLIDHGRITPLTQDGGAWGLTILNHAYTWRSGIGLTRRGTLLYAGGDALSAATLAEALHAAGAVTAMQLDINPFWVRAVTYGRNAAGYLVATPLNPGMDGTGRAYVTGDARDFFYITRP